MKHNTVEGYKKPDSQEVAGEVLGCKKVILITQAKSRKDLDVERIFVKNVRTYHRLPMYIYF